MYAEAKNEPENKQNYVLKLKSREIYFVILFCYMSVYSFYG